MQQFRLKIFSPLYATQWFPGVVIDGVQEIVHDPGDGSTKSSGFAMMGEHKVSPGDWITDTRVARHVVPDDLFHQLYEPEEQKPSGIKYNSPPYGGYGEDGAS